MWQKPVEGAIGRQICAVLAFVSQEIIEYVRRTLGVGVV
jgi:hypothetical protein